MTVKDEERKELIHKIARLVGYNRFSHTWVRPMIGFRLQNPGLAEALEELFDSETLHTTKALAEQFKVTEGEMERMLTEIGLQYRRAEGDGTVSTAITMLGGEYVVRNYQTLWKESVVPLISTHAIDTAPAAPPPEEKGEAETSKEGSMRDVRGHMCSCELAILLGTTHKKVEETLRMFVRTHTFQQPEEVGVELTDNLRVRAWLLSKEEAAIVAAAIRPESMPVFLASWWRETDSALFRIVLRPSKSWYKESG